MGCERRVVYDFVNVIQGEATLHKALIKDKRCEGLYVLASSQTRDKDALSLGGVRKIFDELAALKFDYIVCDSPAGIEKGAIAAMHFADAALVVTNPEISSLRDSDRIVGMLGAKTARAASGQEMESHLLITRYDPARVQSGQMLSIEAVQDFLRLPLIGVIPESQAVLESSNRGIPAIHLRADVAEAYRDVVARFLGEPCPMRFTEVQKTGLLGRIFGGR